MNIFSAILKLILGLFSKPAPSVPNAPTEPKFAVSCVATCFGYQDPGDNGEGAFGDRNDNKTIVGVSVPIPILRESIGYGSELMHQHSVTVKMADGRMVKNIRITDSGPGMDVNGRHGIIWEKEANVGHLLDMTYGTCSELGVKYDPNKGSYKVTYWIEDKNGNPVEIKGLDAPKHYV